MDHPGYVIAIAIVGALGIVLGIAPSITARIRNRRTR
jgi:hypothetical protein